MDKIIYLMLGMVLLMPLVFAEMTTLGVFKQNTDINLIQICSSCSYNNITSVLYPNSSIVVEDVVMTRTDTRYNYTLAANYVSVPGTYIVNGVGDLDGETTVWSYTFNVNPTGSTQTSILDNPMLLILGILGLTLVIFGAAKGIPWFGFIGAIMFLLLGVYTMIYGFNNITSLYTRGVSITFIGMGFIFMFASAYEWLYDSDNN